MSPLVSIIIPTYNRCHLIGETLDSIIAQTFQNWECIVVDDISDDYTPELLEFYVAIDERIKFYKRPSFKQKGANSCRNFGFEKANGSFINWFDSDDLLSPDYLQKQINNLLSKKCDCSISDFSIFKDEVKSPLVIIKNKTSKIKILEDVASGRINPAMQGILLKRDAVKNLSYNEKLTWADDLDFLFKILKNKKNEFAFLNENLVYLRRHSKSLTGNYNRFNLGQIKSELEVRRSILYHIHKGVFQKQEKIGALNMYTRGFKMLFISQDWKQIKQELNKLKTLFPIKRGYYFWEKKLKILFLLHKLNYRKINFQKHIQKLDGLLYTIS